MCDLPHSGRSIEGIQSIIPLCRGGNLPTQPTIVAPCHLCLSLDTWHPRPPTPTPHLPTHSPTNRFRPPTRHPHTHQPTHQLTATPTHPLSHHPHHPHPIPTTHPLVHPGLHMPDQCPPGPHVVVFVSEPSPHVGAPPGAEHHSIFCFFARGFDLDARACFFGVGSALGTREGFFEDGSALGTMAFF